MLHAGGNNLYLNLNTGTPQAPSWAAKTQWSPVMAIDSWRLYPTFGDLNGDGLWVRYLCHT
jgi:hypothetical protein